MALPLKRISTGDKNIELLQSHTQTALTTLNNSVSSAKTSLGAAIVSSAATLQTNINNLQTTVTSQPLYGGKFLSGLALTTGIDNPIAHGLGHAPTHWILAGQNANSTVWATSIDATNIHLSCSANCTISLWVS